MDTKELYPGYGEDVRLARVVPAPRQIAHQELEYFGFIHFTVNTFTGREWGNGEESPAIFNPEKLDAGQWVETAVRGGMTGLILTCKHHDGFCLWPSAYTEHSIKNSPYKGGKGDIVRELSDACREAGLKFGVYLSPWDRNQETYGTGKPYDDYYVNQLTELLTNYGEVFTVWLDGACGEGQNGKKQVYDWERYYEVVRRLQPEANIFGCGPDVRWCGNEAGDTRPSEWSVVAAELADAEKVASESQQEDSEEFRQKKLVSTDMDLGSRAVLKNKKNLIWYPAEVDVSIRPGWFYHEEENDKVRSFENLKEIYLKSVGGNCTLLLNIPPDTNGLIREEDRRSLFMLGDFIRESFGRNLAEEAVLTVKPEKDRDGKDGSVLLKKGEETWFGNPDGLRELEVEFTWAEERCLNYLVVQEAIRFSQRVEQFEVYCLDGQGCWKQIEKGTTVGYKRIVPLHGAATKGLKLVITDARVAPVLAFTGVY